MNGDLISRQAAIDALWELRQGQQMLDNTQAADLIMSGIYLAEQKIKGLPSAQPEIIRCKDCLMHGVCRFERGLGVDGYCSQAERRTDE